jgi:hypothetical protein
MAMKGKGLASDRQIICGGIMGSRLLRLSSDSKPVYYEVSGNAGFDSQNATATFDFTSKRED